MTKATYSPTQAAAMQIARRNNASMTGAIKTAITLCALEVIFPGFVTVTGRNMIDERREIYLDMLDRTSETDTKRNFKRAARTWDRISDTITGAVNTRLGNLANDENAASTAIAAAVRAIETKLAEIKVVVDAKGTERFIRRQSDLDIWLEIAKIKEGEKDAEEKLLDKLEKVREDKAAYAAAEAAAKAADHPEARTMTILGLLDTLAQKSANPDQWSRILATVLGHKEQAEKAAADAATEVTPVALPLIEAA